jgi:RNA polymerase sigma factor (sigma-70 family)
MEQPVSDGRDDRSVIDNVTRYVKTAVAKNTLKNGPLPECDPEDIIQEVLLELAKEYGSCVTRWEWQCIHAKMRELTRKAVRRPHARVKKRQQRGRGREFPLAEVVQEPTSQVTAKIDLAMDVRAAVERLPERQKKIADLLSSGFTVREIADRLGISRQTVFNDRQRIRSVLIGIFETYR